MCAYERKSWIPYQDEIIRRLVAENDSRQMNNKLTWNEIAAQLSRQIPNSNRTGKQCRQRWHNQLDPHIKKYQEWSQEEIKRLFELQDQMGNKWSKIAQQLSGRTDNNVKNYFYSSLRRAVRKINDYISQHKKKTNMKPFQLTLLTKILAISDQKSRDKLDIKAQKAENLATEVKKMLTELSTQQDDLQLTEQSKIFKETLIEKIQQFNRNCKKKKSKKVEVIQEIDYEDVSPHIQNPTCKSESCDQKVEKEVKKVETFLPSFSFFKQSEIKQVKQDKEKQIYEGQSTVKINYIDLQKQSFKFVNKQTIISKDVNSLRVSQFEDNPFDLNKGGGEPLGFFPNQNQIFKGNVMFDSLEMNELHRKINNDSNLQGSINDSTIFKRAASKRQEAQL